MCREVGGVSWEKGELESGGQRVTPKGQSGLMAPSHRGQGRLGWRGMILWDSLSKQIYYYLCFLCTLGPIPVLKSADILYGPFAS